MLSVGKPVFEHFARESEDRFQAKLARYLADTVPGLAELPIRENRAATRAIVEEARSHGFGSEQDIARYAVCAALLGRDFARQFPGAQEILELNEGPAYRARLLEHFTRELFDLFEA